MVKRSKELVLLLVLFLGISWLTATVRAQPTQDAEQALSAELVIRDTPASERDAAHTLSREELLGAQSLDMLVLTEQDMAQLQKGMAHVPDGPEGVTAGALPDPESARLAQQFFPEAWKALDELAQPEQPELTDTQGTEEVQNADAFTTYLVNGSGHLQTIHPHRAIGKLFFTKPGLSGWYSCTAAVIGESTILTAGHCVYSRSSNPTYRGWNANFRFYPALRYDVAPYGYFTSFQQATLSAWANSGDHSNDVAVLRMHNKSGMTIRQWVGKLGVAWNRGVNRHVHAFGYPGNLWLGYYLIVTADQMFYAGSHVVGIGSNMQHGASGGPWVTNYQPYYDWTGRNIVESVNSFITGSPGNWDNGVYGPYFDDDNIQSLCNWAGC